MTEPFSAASEARVSEIVLGERRHGLTPTQKEPAQKVSTIMDRAFWDELHGGRAGWSGNPNPILVEQVAGLTAGRALDVGCGQGDDARWLASRGWSVTASDISSVALDRAESLTSTERIEWLQVDHLTTSPPAQAFDLVTMHFFAIPKPGDPARALADAVAPGGVLLVVQHPVEGARTWRGIDPRNFMQPHDIARLLGPGWTVEIDEIRERTTAPPEGSHHTHDAVLRARRD